MHIYKADILLIDEKIGRSIAKREMIEVHGLLSILAKLHKLGLADYWLSVRKLKSELNMWIGNEAARKAFENDMNE